MCVWMLAEIHGGFGIYFLFSLQKVFPMKPNVTSNSLVNEFENEWPDIVRILFLCSTAWESKNLANEMKVNHKTQNWQKSWCWSRSRYLICLIFNSIELVCVDTKNLVHRFTTWYHAVQIFRIEKSFYDDDDKKKGVNRCKESKDSNWTPVHVVFFPANLSIN